MLTMLFLVLALGQVAANAGDVCLDTYIVDGSQPDGRRLIRREPGFSWDEPEAMRARQKAIAIEGNLAALANLEDLVSGASDLGRAACGALPGTHRVDTTVTTNPQKGKADENVEAGRAVDARAAAFAAPARADVCLQLDPSIDVIQLSAQVVTAAS